MPIINLNNVVHIWTEYVKKLNFYERMELQRMLSASFERDYDEMRKK